MAIRANCKKLMEDIADVYLKSLGAIRKYWEESDERKVYVEGEERIIAAYPMDKRLLTVKKMKDETMAKVEAMISDWERQEVEFFTPHGEDMTDDAKLLSDLFNPSVEQLRVLAERYFNRNATMEQAILNFAEGKDKYEAIRKMPHTQPTATRRDILENFNRIGLKPRFSDSAMNGGALNSAYSYENCYKIILSQWQGQIV